METPAVFRPGTWSYAAPPKNLKALGLPNPRAWQPSDADWKLPENWKEIILKGMKERLEKYRSFRLFLDICVRCGACADKCHFYIGSGDPKNMPVLRAELLRSVYRRYFTALGKALRQARRGAGSDGRRSEGVVLLFLPVHRMPPLLRLLPLRDRPGGDHHDGPGTPQPGGLQHQLGHRAGGQLLPDGKPPGHPAPRRQGHAGIHGRRYRGPHRRAASTSPSTKKGRRSSSSPLRAIISPTPGPTPAWAI